MKKVYVVGNAINYVNFIYDAVLVDTLSEADIVLFTGGEDIDPSFYGEKKHPTTYSNIIRDKLEKEVFDCIKPTQLVVGICRGSQFLCVMNGGKLVQNCNNHGIFETHPILFKETDEIYEITSTHHQMQYPYNLNKEDYTLTATSLHRRSAVYEGGGIDIKTILSNGEPEVVIYHKENKPRCIAIQGHPEYMRKEAPIVAVLNELIDNNLNIVYNNENN